MYSFPNNPPKNADEIAEYLRTSLEQVENGPVKIYKNKTWIQMYGFRRSFQIHGVYINKETNEHVFHVDEYEWDTNREPNFGIWESFDTMIVGVSNRYAKLWNL
jgi:hypothetical protein